MHAPPRDHTKALLELQLRLQSGVSGEEAIAFLVSRGMPTLEARLTVSRIVAKSVREQRTKGLVSLGLAILCFGIASPFIVAFIAGLTPEASGRLHRQAMLQTGSLPLLLVIAGLWLGFRAFRFLTTKRYAMDPDA